MVKIRLKRMGRRHRSFFRIGVFDSRTRRDGKTLELLGHVDPLEKDEARKVKLNKARALHWLSLGAQPSATVGRILKQQGIGSRAGKEAQQALKTPPPAEAAPA